ncbi:MAG: ABC transporter ATP-binding protein [Gammaproteobacteria bacterium]|nr:ABC transporter ATP-binding protein [Gammaproteobacteria bacterium]NNM01468.1 ABC transporter ATP-binding protein [Gammaproteobacteria bacterium]
MTNKAAPLISLTGVHKQYDKTSEPVLSGLDLTVAAGEFLIVLGRSGSGKSTLLNLLAGIDVPDSGSVTVAGNVLSALPDAARTRFRRDHVGLVFQAFNLIPTLSVRENLALPLELAGLKVDDTAIDELLERLGLSGKAARYPEELSGGEQQRVAIGRALVHRPDIILADEPTGNLDLDTGQRVVELLDELVRDRHCTLIMATHSQEVIGYADRVVSIRGGRIETTR